MLAKPFKRIFKNQAEATHAFQLFQQTATQLNITTPYDPRLAVTLSARLLRFDFCRWTVVGFSLGQVEITLINNLAHLDNHYQAETFATKVNEPPVYRYNLPIEQIIPMSESLQNAYDQTLAFMTEKFAGWTQTPYQRHHKPEVAEAMFDTAKRDRLFMEGIPEATLNYERHFTSFQEVVGEESTDYGAEAVEKNFTIGSTSPNPTYSLMEFHKTIHYHQKTIEQWLRAVNRKKQAIFYGPPGTGKTYIAHQLAKYLIADGHGFMEIVQFHSAYSYEDFIQGLRPTNNAQGQLTYSMKPGRFLQFCKRAQQCGDDICVFIIDEINRANLAAVFGELMYLLEYRNQAIRLAGSEEMFAIPNNIRLIGTMNTADRSIALVDHALRRRFSFIHLTPNYNVLQQWHQHHQTGFNPTTLIETLQQINQHINDPHYEIGIAYFLHEGLNKQLEDIWRLEIEPYLEELFLNQPQLMKNFRWETVQGIREKE